MGPFARSSCGDGLHPDELLVPSVNLERTDHPWGWEMSKSGKTPMRSSDVFSLMFRFWLCFLAHSWCEGRAVRAAACSSLTKIWEAPVGGVNVKSIGTVLVLCGFWDVFFLLDFFYTSLVGVPLTASVPSEWIGESQDLAVAIHRMKTSEHIFCIGCWSRTTLVIWK